MSIRSAPKGTAHAAGAVVLVLALALAAINAAGCKREGGSSAGGSGGDPTGGSAGATPAPTGDIVVGAYLSMTGSTADFGTQTKRGFDMAFEEINAAGGVKGRRLRLETLDDQGKADEAGNAVTRLIDINGAVAILGEVASSLSLVGGRICQRRGIPMVTPSSTNTTVTAVGDHVFRVCFIDPFQGYVMARFARDNQHLSRIAIFKDVRNDYSIGLAESFRAEFLRAGGTIVAEESYNQGDTDFAAQLTKIKATEPDGLFIPGYYGEVGNIARQARRLGLTVPLLGGDGWDSPQLRAIGGPDIIGAYYSNHFAPDNPSPSARAFIEDYRRRYNEAPTSLAAQGYDAAAMLFDAMKRASDLTPRAIRDALAATRDFVGVTGKIAMDEQRNPTKPAVVLRVGAEGDVYEATIEPVP
jgi:branched-chain amino acid transport system substrate-binding protein